MKENEFESGKVGGKKLIHLSFLRGREYRVRNLLSPRLEHSRKASS